MMLKLILPAFYFFNLATRKFRITYAAPILFLLDIAVEVGIQGRENKGGEEAPTMNSGPD